MTDTGAYQLGFNHLRAWLGREESISDVITGDLVRKFNATLELSGEVPKAGQIAPPLIHYCLGQTAAPASRLGEDGHPKRGRFLPPVPLPRRMWAGGSLTFSGDLRVGDTVRRVSRISDIVHKEGRSGPLCFVTLDHVLDVGGKVVIVERQDIVYRGPANAGDVLKPAGPANRVALGRHHRVVVPSAPLLFRYSALTFNAHRIHYDRPYATDIEFYPGLVVHGPLQATLLLHFAKDLKGKAPTQFSFRSQSPLFDDDRINIHALEGDGRMTLWTMRDGGPVAMSAEASWI